MKYTLGFILLLASPVAFSQSANSSQTSPSVAEPICVVDGKILPSMVKSKADSSKMVRAIDSVNALDIDKIEVLNGAKAASAYGDAGKNGVILITMKKRKSN